MGRRYEGSPVTTVASGSFGTLLTVPAGHKYEVTDIFVSGPGSSPTNWLVAVSLSGSAVYLYADPSDGAGFAARHIAYGGLIMYPADFLAVFVSLTGGGNTQWWVSYVDVDFT